jgi:hypothetical protein
LISPDLHPLNRATTGRARRRLRAGPARSSRSGTRP